MTTLCLALYYTISANFSSGQTGLMNIVTTTTRNNRTAHGNDNVGTGVTCTSYTPAVFVRNCVVSFQFYSHHPNNVTRKQQTIGSIWPPIITWPPRIWNISLRRLTISPVPNVSRGIFMSTVFIDVRAWNLSLSASI